MNINALFLINAVGFGIGLAMDAFSVSMANGLAEPKMKKNRMSLIAGVFAGFQIGMPLIGWICIHTIAAMFESFQKFIPWIALILLGYIGGKMLIEGIRNADGGEEPPAVSFKELIVQGIATSIDALSVGFTIAEYNFAEALLEALIIGVVTFFICIGGLMIGKKFGTKLANKASILGGIILLAIGLEIFISGIIG
ncbi:MAG: manganese efflux pump [Clostridiales bacterium]|nr:manganese efflux pump [Candidatus Blautia equi]